MVGKEAIILCPEITVEAPVGVVAIAEKVTAAIEKNEVAIAEMVTAAIEKNEDFVEGNPDNPTNEDRGEGEGVPVAKVPCEDVSVDDRYGKFADCNTGNAIATHITITSMVIGKITIPVMLS